MLTMFALLIVVIPVLHIHNGLLTFGEIIRNDVLKLLNDQQKAPGPSAFACPKEVLLLASMRQFTSLSPAKLKRAREHSASTFQLTLSESVARRREDGTGSQTGENMSVDITDTFATVFTTVSFPLKNIVPFNFREQSHNE